IGPGFRAETIATDRKVAVETDCHAGFCKRIDGSLELLVGDELQPYQKINLVPVLLGKSADSLRTGILEFLGPTPPIRPLRIITRKMLAQDLKDRPSLQALAVRRA